MKDVARKFWVGFLALTLVLISINAVWAQRTERFDRVQGLKAFGLTDGRVVLTWSSFENVASGRTLVYRVYREEKSGLRTEITPSEIAGTSLKFGSNSQMSETNRFNWVDTDGSTDFNYYLEEIDFDGRSTYYGPVRAEEILGFKDIEVSPLVEDVNKRATQNGPRGWVTMEDPGTDAPNLDTSPAAIRQRQLSAFSGAKIGIKTNGWYRVERSALLPMGIDTQINSANIQLTADGIEQPFKLNADGSIEFYGRGLDTVTTETRIYYLQDVQKLGQRVQSTNLTASGTPTVNNYSFTVERRDRNLYANNILNGEGDNFFGAVLASAQANQIINVPDPDTAAGGTITLSLAVQGFSNTAHSVQVKFNGSILGTIDSVGFAYRTAQFTVNLSQLQTGNNTVSFQSIGGTGDISLLDYIRIAYPRKYKAVSNNLDFSVNSGAVARIEGFTAANVRLMDITNPLSPVELNLAAESDGQGGFRLNLPSFPSNKILKAFVTPSTTVAELTANEPSKIWRNRRGANFVIIVPAAFRAALEPLKTRRQNQGYSVNMVTIEDLYDEYSFGMHTPEAITAFLRDTALRWRPQTNYVLLVGDATYDPRNREGVGNFDFMPTKFVDTILNEAASDEALADFNNDGIGEMMLGRLSVRTAAEATTQVNKIIAYEDRTPTTPYSVLMVADEPIGYDFVGSLQRIAQRIPSGTNLSYITRGTRTVEETRTDIMNSITAGKNFVTYSGHGSLGIWSSSQIFRTQDVLALNNTPKLPIFIVLNCLNGNFVTPTSQSLAEAAMRNPNGGSVAFWASSASTTPDHQEVLGGIYYANMFTPNMALGQAIKNAKLSVFEVDVRRSWILFGDPTLKLR